MNEFFQKNAKLLKYGGIALLVWVVGCIVNPVVLIDAGHRGVVKNFGAVSADVLSEGIHLRIPIVQQVEELNVQVKKTRTKASAASRDLQQVTSLITLNWHPIPDRINTIYQKIGTSYAEKVIDPAVQETVKSITAEYTAEELITKRSVVATRIQEMLVTRLEKFDIAVDQFSVEDFQFSDEFSRAIESKQVAEQEALKAERTLQRIRIEAEQKIATARAEAEELRLKRASISPLMVQLRWIEKWNGELPTYVAGGNTANLIQIPQGQ